MFIPGHFGISFFIAYMILLLPLYTAIGSLIPDLIDKPLNILGILPSSRHIGHTLLGVFTCFLFVYLITRNKKISFSISFGYLLHLFEDLPFFVPWFYPFVKYDFPTGPFSFHYTLFAFVFDVIGIMLLVYVLKKDRKLLGHYKNSLAMMIKRLKSLASF